MNLRKPFITTLLIVFLVINLIFLSFLVSFKHVISKEYLSSIAKDFDIVNYIKDKEYIKNSTNNLEYPPEVYDYINLFDFNQLANQSIDNLLNNNNIILDNSDISKILKKSVSLYDLNNKSDSSKYVKDDIIRISTETSYKINNFSIVKLVKISSNFVNSIAYYIPFAVAILLTGLIIFYETKNGLLVNGIIYIIYSFYTYYLNYYFISRFIRPGSFYSYFRNIEKYTFNLDNLYTICFILGFVLLLIYMIFYLKKAIRDIRLSSYENWR